MSVGVGVTKKKNSQNRDLEARNKVKFPNFHIHPTAE